MGLPAGQAGLWELSMERLKAVLSSLFRQSALCILHLMKFLIPKSALRIRHSISYYSLGQQKILFVLALIVLALLYSKFYYHPSSPPAEEVFKEVVVEVVGEIQKPGIYIFKNPPTLQEVIDQAGGLHELVLFDTPTFSRVLETGTLLHVSKESQEEIRLKLGQMEARNLLAFTIPLDLNRVSAQDLCLIPGIGESLAREIVTYREKRRGFRAVEELKNVEGIGEKKWKNFRPFFTLKP